MAKLWVLLIFGSQSSAAPGSGEAGTSCGPATGHPNTPKPPVSQGLGYLGSLGESATADVVASGDCLQRVRLGKPDEALLPGT
jgi:hypothetical protein